MRELLYLVIVLAPYLPATALKWLDSRAPSQQHVAWELVKLSELAPLVSVVLFAGLLVWLVRRQRPQGIGLTVALQLPAVLIAGVAFYFFAIFDLFEDRVVLRAESPDGSRVAYVYRAGLFCDHAIYLRPSGSIIATRIEGPSWECRMPDGGAVSPQIRWDSPSADPSLYHSDGTPVPTSKPWFTLPTLH